MNTREEWLMQAVEQIKPIFERMGNQVPPVKVFVGLQDYSSESCQSYKRAFNIVLA